MLALVTDAFGGRGGIAQYNRDFLGAVVNCGAVSSITVLPSLRSILLRRQKRSSNCVQGPVVSPTHWQR